VTEEIAQRVRAAPARAGDTKIVAIDGPSGSGKTTLAGRLPGPVMHMEDIYPGWDGLRDSIRRLVEWVLEPLAAGGRVGWRRYDWEHGRYAEWHDLPAPRTLVIEGVGAGALAAAPYVSVLIWVDAPLWLRRHRALARDGETYRPHWDRWAGQEREYFAGDRVRERADLLIGSG
jgi:hypothetical protein